MTDFWTQCRLLAKVLAVCAVFVAPQSFAAHFLAADIEYSCLGGTTYEVTLNIYRDCDGAAMLPQDIDFESDCGTSFTIQGVNPAPLNGVDVSQLCADSLVNSACNGGTLPGTELYQYTTIVNLANCDGWRISWSSCCRSLTINAVGTFGTYVEAVLNSVTAPCNNSPVFNDGFIPYVCVNQPITYNFGVIESDGDSLAYTLIDGRFAAPVPTPIFYQGAYSGAAPFPVVTLDPLTGQLNFTAPMIGNYVVAVLVEEFDAAGNLIGSVMRDMMVIVLPCTGNVPNSASIGNNTAGTITGGNSIQLCDGEAFCVDVIFSDPDVADVLTVTASAATLPPGATVTVAGTNPAVATFCWTTDITQSPVNVILTATDGSCPIENLALAAININIFNNGVSPDPGVDNSILLCENNSVVDLFLQLGGTPDVGGTWTFPNGSPHTGMLDPATDPDGPYTYTVPGICGAADASAVVSVSINPISNSGISSTLNLCTTSATINLISALAGGPAAGGAWTDPSNAVHNGSFDPAVDPGGVYTYTITGIVPCPDASSTVTINLSSPPDAGNDSAVNLCAGGAAVNLFTLLGGTPDVGGSWTGPGGAPTSSNFTPGVQAPGNYTYSIPGAAPCGGASAVVTITIVGGGDAGTNSTLDFCSGGGVVTNLFGQLGGTPDPGGTWTDPSNTAHNGVFDPASDPAGVYTYTIAAVGSCPAVAATVTIAFVLAPDPGLPGIAVVCGTAFPFVLIDSLGGTPDPGGSWTDPNSAGFGGTFNPATGIAGIYTYTVTGTAPCPDASATVVVTVSAAGNAGTSASLTLCETDPAQGLFPLLVGADAGGTWTDPSNAPFAQPFDPSTDPAGIYTYTLAGVGNCPSSSATVTTTINPAADAGANGTLDICANGSSVDLFSSLLGTPALGGTWADPSGNPFVQPFDPAVHVGGNYTYTVNALAPCVSAQAMVTVNLVALPNSGTNTFWDLCETYPTLNLINLLGGTPDAGGVWTDPNSVVVAGGVLNPATNVSGIYLYTVQGAAPCPSTQSQVNIVINQTANPGANGTLSLCDNGPITDLFNSIGGTPDIGGTWNDPAGAAFSGQFDPSSDPGGVYWYYVQGQGSCPTDSASVTVSAIQASNAGSANSLSVCSNGSNVNLITVLGGSPNPGGAWLDPNGNPMSGVLIPSSAPPGIYIYTVSGIPPCADASATVNVTISQPGNAGSDATIDLCSTDAAVNLFTQLGGTPTVGGTWSGPAGASNGTFDPATDTPGAYTYSIVGVFPCLNVSATVTVNVNAAADAGTASSVTVCDQSPAMPLLNSLGGSPNFGGTWADPSGNPHSGVFSAASDPPGLYTYTVLGVAPCANASSTLMVSVTSSPNAGSNGSLSLCSTDAVTDLFNSLGTPDPGGTWTDPSSASFSGQFDPASDPAGVYTYTLNATAPCLDDDATVTVTIVGAADAGLDASITLCPTGGTSNLFNQLGGTPDAGGAWTGPNGAFSGIFDPSTDPVGNYTYTVSGTIPCADMSALVTVTFAAVPSAGTAGLLTICSAGTTADLFSQLGGTPDLGGTWSDPNGNPVVGTYDPASDPPGNYTYSIAGSPPCPGASQVVVVNLIQAADAGIDAAVSLCATAGTSNLFSQLGGTPVAGGTWQGPAGAFSGTFDPATDPAGNYTYTVLGTAPCADASALVSVTIITTPDAGSAGNVAVCSSAGPVNLFNQLGGSPDVGGSWSDANGNPHSGSFDPATDPAGNYTYTITGVPPCPSASQLVVVSIVAAPNAGTNAAVNLCITGGTANLFLELGGLPSAGGVWTGPAGAFSGTFDPTADPAGVYTYLVSGTAPCADASATVMVTISTIPDAGTAGVITVCATGSTVDLFNQLGGSPDLGGTWTDPNNNVHTGMLDPSVDPAGNYTYTIAAVPPCPGAAQIVSVNIFAPVDAGNNASVTLCVLGATTQLFAHLGGTPNVGGTWQGPGGAFSGTFDPSVDPGGNYTYTVLGTAPCPDASAVVTVNLVSSPNAGSPGSLAVCVVGNVSDLFSQLGGTPDPGGTWSDPNSAAHSGMFDPISDPAGVYTYTLAGAAPCPGVSQTVTVTLTPLADAGVDGNNTVCTGDPAFNLNAFLGGTPNPIGTWTDPNGVANSGTVDPAIDPAGAYMYIVDGGVCPDDTAFVNVLVVVGPNAGTSNAITICSDANTFSLVDSLIGTPDLTGAWTDAAGNPIAATFDPSAGLSGIFTYTVTGNASCPDDVSTLTVAVSIAPDAGADTSIVLCANDAPSQLIAWLAGTPDLGGVWTDPNGVPIGGTLDPALAISGSYLYTVVGPLPCVAASASLNLTVVPVADAGQDSSIVVCSADAPFDLITGLAGSPVVTGSWVNSTGTAVGATFDPATDPSDVYVYVVNQTNGCGDDTAFVSVQVVQAPVVGSGSSVSLCANDAPFTMLDSLLGNPAQSGSWFTSGGATAGPAFDPSTDLAGSYLYVVQGTAPCLADTAMLNVSILSTPNPQIVADISPGCAPTQVVFTNLDNLVGNCLWSFGDGSSSTSCSGDTVIYTAGSYSVNLIVSLPNGCSASTSTSSAIDIFDMPVAGINAIPPVVTQSDPVVYFQNTATGWTDFYWDLGEFGINNDVSPTITFPSEQLGQYEVCQYVFASPTCFDTACVMIEVTAGLTIFVPNAFTPDGNGTNDSFLPIVDGIMPGFYEFRIFNRWGDLLFFSDQPGVPWDGADYQQDVYIWEVVAQDSFVGDKVRRIGHVTLVR